MRKIRNRILRDNHESHKASHDIHTMQRDPTPFPTPPENKQKVKDRITIKDDKKKECQIPEPIAGRGDDYMLTPEVLPFRDHFLDF